MIVARHVVSVHTGFFGKPHTEEGAGEILRTDSPEFPPVLDRIRRQQSLELPPGRTWSGLIAWYRRIPGGNLESTNAIAGTVELYAHCAWLGAFLDARRSGDMGLQRRAAQVIAESVRWPQMADQPPSTRAWHQAEARAAAAGRAGGTIAQDVAVNCGRAGRP